MVLSVSMLTHQALDEVQEPDDRVVSRRAFAQKLLYDPAKTLP